MEIDDAEVRADHSVEQENSVSRRKMLKSTGAAIGVPSLTLNQNDRKKSEERESSQEVVERYKDSEAARHAIVSNTPKIRTTLAKEIVSKGRIDAELKRANVLQMTELRDLGRGIHVGAIKRENRWSARITAHIPTDDYQIKFYVEPQASNAYAYLESHGNDNSYLIEEGNSDVEPNFCYTMDGYACVWESWSTCNLNNMPVKYERIFCTSSGECSLGDELGCCTVGEDGDSC